MNRAVKILKAPFLRNNMSVQSLMGDVLTVMPFIYVMPIFFYGFRVLKSLIISLAVCYILDQGCLYLKNKNKEPHKKSRIVYYQTIDTIFKRHFQ